MTLRQQEQRLAGMSVEELLLLAQQSAEFQEFAQWTAQPYTQAKLTRFIIEAKLVTGD